ncbi:hypothetical protein Pmani_032957 [Petrolisthes manimaculis]|uniref:Heparan sulfate 2-O-sulfotransferase pipe n=1 Tax=Petrolisthes manimaculis TaxID=1843537 RepID=A0AAE1NRY0_9EUCA|nr:hypothetical protein Pmani_032957 [Petrolisthes manimaculis]
MRRWRLMIRKWRNSEGATTVMACARYLPYVMCLLFLKVYVMLLLVHYHHAPSSSSSTSDDYQDDPIDQSPSVTTSSTSTTTEEPGWHERQEVLARLNNTIIQPSGTNRTPDTIWLFFNRIPRTGGQTLVTLIKSLGKDLDYNHQEHVYRTPWQRLLTVDEQRNLATWFEYNYWPKSYDRFSLHVNFTKHRSKYVNLRPAYVTLVRDPVDKFISYYRFKRVDNERVKLEMAGRERQTPGSGRVWYWRKVEACILEGDPECSLTPETDDFTSAIPFLCGQHPQCLKLGDRWALQMAKYQAEYEYAVVGLTEEWNTTLAVLEHYLPMFFRGARQRYWSQEFEDNHMVNKNMKKYKEVREEVTKLLKEKLALEYELYEFLRQRLHQQYLYIEPLDRGPTTSLPTQSEGIPPMGILDKLSIELMPRNT